VCPSCVELSRDGGGSLDVVEIDAASHNGVDDARDLRERAVFAPARDRYKIFILDEAHMVTPQGFNALLKIVEEPPEHVKFIFATTEPEKVIGTIRSRTHHYPFRLVPPAQMLDYVQEMCASENVTVEPGVLPLVVRAGGGSVRDTLSLLDQLIAGSEGGSLDYERAVALLGYTHGALLDEVIDALGIRDAAAVFAAVDRVIQTGQDPRRFVEDLLERLRDLIIVAATSGNASAVLRGVPEDQLTRMGGQSALFGPAELSRSADVVNSALSELTGATSPRLHLELMVARILVPASDDSERGALARVERLERRIGVAVAEPATALPVSAAVSAAAVPAKAVPAKAVPAKAVPAEAVPAKTASAEAVPPKAAQAKAAPANAEPAVSEPSTAEPATAEPATAEPATAEPATGSPPAGTQVSLQQVKDAWPEVLDVVEKAKRSAWMVVYTARPLELRGGGVLVLSFASQNDVDALKQSAAVGETVGDHLKRAVLQVLGFTPSFLARVDAIPASTANGNANAAASAEAEIEHNPEEPTGWAVAAIPASAGAPEKPTKAARAKSSAAAPENTANAASANPAKAASEATSPSDASVKPTVKDTRYGESVIREVLGASFIEEHPIAPRVVPQPKEN